MVKSHSDLLLYTRPEYGVPESFFEEAPGGNSCIFLVSCFETDRIVYMGDSCETITGYPPEKFLKSGMDFWFPLIHPEDLPVVTEKIIQSQQEVFKKRFAKENLSPLVLEYRFKRPGGEWGKMKDTKYLLFPGNEVAIDKILCKFELMATNEGEEMNAEEILRKNKACTRMLEFAIVHNNGQTKRSLNEQADKLTTEAPSLSSPLTKREKEILLLIGKGLSTKMIADKCSISINTVETHRRHLLEKLQVKNSMELIKEASKVFWL